MTILIIEDDFGLAELIKEKVAECGYETVGVNTAGEALAWLSKHTPYIMLLDYSLPDMNAKEFISELQGKEGPLPPFIVLTGQGDERIAVDMMKIGARDYIIKDSVVLDKLPEVIRRVDREIENENKRKQAEWNMRESEEKFRSYIENAPAGVFIADETGRYLQVNPAASRITGYAHDELLAMSISNLVPPESLELAANHFRRATETGQASGELILSHKKGQPICCLVDAVKLSNTRIMGFVQDITARKQTEESLRESEERLQEAQKIAHIGNWEWNIATNQVYWSDELYRIYGYEPQEISPDYDIVIQTIHPKSKEEFLAAIDAALKEGKSFDMEYDFSRKDGFVSRLHTIGQVIRDEYETALSMRGIVQDITERKRALNELHDAQARIHHIITFSPTITYSLTLDFVATWVSPNVESILGYTVAECLAPGWWADHLRPDDRDRFLAKIQHLFDGNRYAEEYRFQFKDGIYRWISDELYLISDAQGNPVEIIGAWHDITERKRAEEERIKLEGQLYQSQKIESVGRLAGGVAHDFNNMLGLIIGHAEMALDHVDPALPIHADLREIIKAAERSANLTRQLLAFARQQTIAPKVLDLNETITDMLKMLQRLIGEDINLKWQSEANLWQVKMDPTQIDQIMANLCINARDAITGVGKLTIETGNISLDEAYCAIHAGFVPGEYVMIKVSDDGCGMNKETIAKIFEPFFTTKEMGKGTGLGLATVYGIVKQNNGFINVYSEPGQGTTFTIYLPRHIGKDEKGQTKPQEQKTLMRGQETLLLVEDEPALLELNKMLLEKQGYQVLAAGSPNEAIRLAGEHAREIDLLMTDVVMPEMNGRDLAKHLMTLNPHLKCLFTSGYTADVIAHHGVLDEGVYFIQKPFSRQDLAAKVREVLDQK